MSEPSITSGDAGAGHRASRGAFLGMTTVDLIYLLESQPLPNSKVAARGLEICAGGPACNAAATFASLGAAALLFTPLGRHPLTAVIREDLGRFDLAIVDLAPHHRGVPTLASGLVAADSGERTVVAAIAEGVRPSVPDAALLEGCSVLLCDGYWLEAAAEAASFAHARGIPVVLDGGSWKRGLDRLLPWTSVAICSRDFRPPGCHSMEEAHDFLRSRGVQRLASTRGEQPVVYSEPGNAGEVAVAPARVVDTLGAGDVFHGAFCRYYSVRADFPAALEFAVRAATLKCATPGTRAWMGSEEAATLRESLSTF